MNKNLETVLAWLDRFGDTARSQHAVLKRIKSTEDIHNVVLTLETLEKVANMIDKLFDRLDIKE